MNEFGKFVLRVHKLMDDSPAFTAGMVLVLVLCIVWSWWKGRKAKMAGAVSGVVGGFVNHSGERGLLSQAVYWWSRYDPLRVVDLLRSLIIIGASGSGKTSGSGFQLAKAMVGMGRKIALCILSSKPEDRGFWVKVFGRRRKDLLIFGPTSPLRFNLIDFLQQSGADTREITQAIMTVGEIVRQNGGGRDNEPFWRQQYERMIFCAVEVLRLALGRVTAPDVQKFISDAAQTPDMMREEIWQKGYHNRCLEAAYNNPKTALDRHNFELALDYYHNQFPTMSDRTRSSILAGVMGILHVFNTGIVRELVSTTTNISP
ncbi:MAG TPA: hypothetical protein VMF69_22135, partial [Gemmataceae bacterium]|nr:hypothetical protein [Gemmataceae bacterium]